MPDNSSPKASSPKKKHRPSTAHKSKSEEARELLTQGLKPPEISRKLGVTRELVYAQQHKLKALERKSYTYETLPKGSMRAGENWAANLPSDQHLVEATCVSCLKPMWTRDPKLEDLCEMCMYAMATEAAEAMGQRSINSTPTSFEDEHDNPLPDLGDPWRLF